MRGQGFEQTTDRAPPAAGMPFARLRRDEPSGGTHGDSNGDGA